MQARWIYLVNGPPPFCSGNTATCLPVCPSFPSPLSLPHPPAYLPSHTVASSSRPPQCHVLIRCASCSWLSRRDPCNEQRHHTNHPCVADNHGTNCYIFSMVKFMPGEKEREEEVIGWVVVFCSFHITTPVHPLTPTHSTCDSPSFFMLTSRHFLKRHAWH